MPTKKRTTQKQKQKQQQHVTVNIGTGVGRSRAPTRRRPPPPPPPEQFSIQNIRPIITMSQPTMPTYSQPSVPAQAAPAAHAMPHAPAVAVPIHHVNAPSPVHLAPSLNISPNINLGNQPAHVAPTPLNVHIVDAPAPPPHPPVEHVIVPPTQHEPIPTQTFTFAEPETPRNVNAPYSAPARLQQSTRLADLMRLQTEHNAEMERHLQDIVTPPRLTAQRTNPDEPAFQSLRTHHQDAELLQNMRATPSEEHRRNLEELNEEAARRQPIPGSLRAQYTTESQADMPRRRRGRHEPPMIPGRRPTTEEGIANYNMRQQQADAAWYQAYGDPSASVRRQTEARREASARETATRRQVRQGR